MTELQDKIASVKAEVGIKDAPFMGCIYAMHKITNLAYQMPHWNGSAMGRKRRERVLEEGRIGRVVVVPRDELEKFHELSKPWSKSLGISMIVLHALYVVKNSFYLTSKLKFIDPHSAHYNLETVSCNNGLSSYKQLSCLRTNCTRLTSGQDASAHLEQHLANISIYAICHDYLGRFFIPTISFYPIGFLQLCWLSCWVVVCVIVFPLYGMLRPIESIPIMNLHCPISGIQRARNGQLERVRKYMSSFESYKQNMRRRARMRGEFGAFVEIRGEMHENFSNQEAPQYRGHNYECKRRLKRQPSLYEARECLEQKALCLPIEFTDWWRMLSPKQYMLNLLQIYLTCLSIPAFMFFVTCFRPAYEAQLDQFAQQIRQDNCAFWRASKVSGAACEPNSANRDIIDIRTVQHKWTLYTLLENSTFLMWTLCINGPLMADLFYGIVYLKVRLLELREQLLVAIEMSNLMRALGDAKGHLAAPPSKATGGNFSPLHYIRREFIKTIELRFMFVFRRRHRRNHGQSSTQVEELLAYQELAFNILQETDFRQESYLNYMESVQLNAWSFTESLRQLNGQSTRGLMLCYTIAYGFTLISALTHKRFPELVNAALFCTLLTIMATNFVIVLCSNVHTCANKLRPKFWSLIAQHAKTENPRIGHARLLLLKQMSEMDNRGGYALRMFNRINVTYVGIIELSIWTSSIMLLAYSRH